MHHNNELYNGESSNSLVLALPNKNYSPLRRSTANLTNMTNQCQMLLNCGLPLVPLQDKNSVAQSALRHNAFEQVCALLRRRKVVE